jgi:hypothetical protein
MTSGGWIKLHRKLLDWEWFQDSHMVHLFVDLILTANVEDKFWKGMLVKRGQLISGRKSLSEKTGITEQTVRTCLERLRLTGEITINSTNKFSIITICNYDFYQSTNSESIQHINQHSNQQLTIEQPPINHNQRSKENDKLNQSLKFNAKIKHASNLLTKDFEYDWSIVQAEMLPAVKLWIDYKEERKDKKYGQKAFKAMIDKLNKLSNGRSEIALEIINQSIAYNWSGFFEISNTRKVNSKPIYNNNNKNWDDEERKDSQKFRNENVNSNKAIQESIF